MAQVLAFAPRQMEAVAAPLPRHVDLAKQFKADHPASDPRLSPSPPANNNTASFRKRASTIGAVDAARGMFESPPRNSAPGSHLQDGSRDIICLCTPAPKIPRPRNAFILYRQHHQAQVTADNPKLSNPDISKIIGEKWKNEGDEIKKNWKKLAEEEKQRHQNQYPNYRYQPRRGNKSQSAWANTSPTEDQGRCQKCNGRAMNTPQTPSTPYSTSPAGKMGTPSQGPPSLQRLDTALSRRSSFEHSPTSVLPFASKLPSFRDVDSSDPMSPEMKRRRADGAGGYHAINGTLGAYGGKQLGDFPLTPTEGLAPSQMPPFARATLPELGGLPRSQSGPMPPPLRPTPSASWLDTDPHGRRHSGFDESLRLPPLHTSLSPSSSRGSAMDTRPVSLPTSLAMTPTRDNAIGRGGTLRDMIMSISFKRKIAVLASICQPAPPLLNEANFDGIRGAFIAVEGPDAMLRQGAGIAIEKGLVACGEILLKVWRDDADGHESTGWDEGNALPLGRRGGSKFGDYFEPYLKSISAWQKKSRQIGRHITGTRTLLSSAEEQRADGERVAAQAQSTEACTPPDDDLEQAAATKMPVALANEGFSLTISDRHACALPIPDTYSVVDHWQWMATLWRGTVCPDLIVYVMPSDEEENNERRTVELSRRMGLIVVKVPAGKGLDEATERRLAFEVMEWMREASFREPLPRDWRSELV
ncbi:hypothetical protein G6O67_001453 [Ophiocordyceps sinensis]|uniref:HMG box domain-containing protein n=1 Tax=Ophiocordyceps sinensis TaxID=72228 RepID=A0A8H4PXG0_9HYPO|nr:hypothetical protein G6O67_001453 [Ophiocordyceps sinensis]